MTATRKTPAQPKAIKPGPSANAATKTPRLQRRFPGKAVAQRDEYIATFCQLNNLKH